MKNLVALIIFFIVVNVSAQVKVPQASPKSKIEQTIGLTEVAIDYCRPSSKGRIVFGELVKFGENWRTGANANTTISFSDNVKINNIDLKAGKYALYTTPRADLWDIIFYTDTNNWGLPKEWNDEKVALKISVKPETSLKNIETFTISLQNLSTNGATLEFAWERTIISIPIQVPTEENANQNIAKVLSGPSASDYYAASNYYYANNLDITKSLEWINEAITLSKDSVPFFYYRLKALILAKSGDKKQAIEFAQLSLDASIKANNQEYIRLNKESINEWSKK